MRRGAAIAAVIACAAGLSAVASPVAAAQTSSEGLEPAECPSTVVVAARGNDSKDMVTPTQYSPDSPYVSSGREGQNIRTFLQFAEQRHLDQTGESLLADTYVLGLPEELYPGDIPTPDVSENEEVLALLSHAGPIADGLVKALRRNVDVGVPGVRTAIEEYEQESGCAPRYVLIGYSLGATVLPQHERWLAERGQLAGVLYAGSAHQAPGDPHIIGGGQQGALLGSLQENSRDTSATDNTILYCLPDDLVCDPSPQAVVRSLEEDEGGPHSSYFLEPSSEPLLGEVADEFARWITAAA